MAVLAQHHHARSAGAIRAGSSRRVFPRPSPWEACGCPSAPRPARGLSTASSSESRSPHEADHVDLGFRGKELHEPFAHDEAVFGEGNPDGHAQNDRWSSRPESGGARLPGNTGARPLAPVRRRGSMLYAAMEPASIAARPAAHRSRRRRAAGRTSADPSARVHRRAPGWSAGSREARDAPFVLLVAPAGYGKTTLLSEWAASRRAPVRLDRPGRRRP